MKQRVLACVLALPLVTASATAQEFDLETVVTAPRSLQPWLPTVKWITGERAFSIERPNQRGVEAVFVVRLDGTPPDEAFDAEDVHAAFEHDRIAKDRLPPFSWHDAGTIRVELPDGVWRWDLAKERPERVLEFVEDATARVIAPAETHAAFVQRHDVVIRKPGGALHRVTWDGKDGDIVYGGAAHRAEFGIRDGLWWDPTGRFLAFSREDMRPIAVYPYVEYGTQPAEPKHGRYPMAGRAHSKVTIGVYDTADDSLRYLEHDPDADLYWTNVTFAPDGGHVFVALVNRGQNHMSLVEFDTATRERVRELFAESDPEWIEPEHGPMFLPDGSGGFLWFSSRDGFRHLYVHARDGERTRQLTRGPFDLAAFGGFTSDGEHAYVTASGENPLEMHLWRVALATGEMTQITNGRGRHQCMISDHDDVLARSSSAVDPGRITLYEHDAEPRLVQAAVTPAAIAASHTDNHEFFTLEATDGSTLHGVLWKPPNFDPAQRYPLIHYVYGGPHSQLVTDTYGCGLNLWLRYMATQGYLVSCVDNRGTDNRGIEFAQSIFRRLPELEVADNRAAVEMLASRSYVDRDRIGVHGWSYGGYMTLNLMLRAADLFDVGVAGAPVTDWSRYETGYTERYMDTPQENADGYAASSVLPLVKQLRGRLLLITPTDDHTVMPSHSVAFLQACVDEQVLIDHMAYPMQQHGLRGKHRQHFYRLMTRYFDEHLKARRPATEAAARK